MPAPKANKPERVDDLDPAQRARDICLRLLGVRARSRAELADALRRRGIPDGTAEAVLGRFDEVGLIDDAAFAEAMVQSGHRHRGLGRRALAAELRRKGIDDELTRAAVAAVDPADEERRARELVRRRLRTSDAGDAHTQLRRLVGMLARKGYPEGLAFRVARDELRAADARLLPDLEPDFEPGCD